MSGDDWRDWLPEGWQVVPGVDGQVQFEWHENGRDVEIALWPNGEFGVVVEPIQGESRER